jgi:hypothetical protein
MKVEELLLVESVPSKLGQEAVISYTADVALLGGRKNEQQGRITKVTENLPVLLIGNGGEYQAARRSEAGHEEFQAQARKWGTRREDGIIENKGELYVEFIVKGRGQSKYLLDNQPIDKADIIGLKPSVTPSDEASGVILRAIKIKNLTSVN